MVIGRYINPDGWTPGGDSTRVSGAWWDIAGVLCRTVVMLTLATFAILVLLPAAIAAQATVPI